LQVILDLLPHSSSIFVGRMRLEDVAALSIADRGLFTMTMFNTLYPVERLLYVLCKQWSVVAGNVHVYWLYTVNHKKRWQYICNHNSGKS